MHNWLKIDWDAIRAYASLVILTVVAILGIWKDSKDYKKRAKEERGRWRILKQNAVPILYVITFTAFFLGGLDIHSARHQAYKDKADALATEKTNENQIQDLKNTVDSGNKLLGQQRQDFLEQFADMSKRVASLQTEVKTSNLQQEADQLRADLEATKKALYVPQATLSFSFVPFTQQNSDFVVLNEVDGSVTLSFTVVNNTDANALEGTVIFRACNGCKIKSITGGFTKLPGEPDNQQNLDFQHIFARTNLPTMEATIIPPPDAESFQIGISYRCRTCNITDQNHLTLPSDDLGMILIGPHWRPNQHPQFLVAPLYRTPAKVALRQ